MTGLSQSSPIKRARRTAAEMDDVREALVTVAGAGNGMTIRHLFYKLVAAGVIEKTEQEYSNVVIRLGLEMRRNGCIPYGKIIDGSRLYSVPETFGSVRQAIAATARLYRRNYWLTADRTLEVWCEKDAIRALVQPVTSAYAVPLMVTRGFASESVVHSLAVETERTGKPKIILSLSDYDPSGSIMLRDIIDRAKHYAPRSTFLPEQVALTREQIDTYSLPTRPTKNEGNRHAAGFKDDRSVELDAMEPDNLRDLLNYAIAAHVDFDTLKFLRVAEESEKNTLIEMARGVAA
jgi:hypothetical protein